jgi:hypothetical protein
VLPFSLSIFSSVGIEVLFTVALQIRYSATSLEKVIQCRNLLLVNSDGDIVGAMLEMGRCSQTEKSVKVKTQVARHILFRCIHDENLMEIPQCPSRQLIEQ